MGVFDPIADTANALRTEGQEIKLSFKQGCPAAGQGTIEWNIPGPALGCASGIDSVYAGIVLLLSSTPLDATNIPQDGVTYISDPTADFDLSTADRIGTALVVGAFYECEKKCNGEPFTMSVIINDLQPNTTYYVAGYAVDCQTRYHADGVRAYSDKFGNIQTDVPATQIINLGNAGGGVLPTDGTGLIPGIDYEFDIIIDDKFAQPNTHKTVEFIADGINLGTYQDLIDEINRQILLVGNPLQSPLPPNADSFFWDVTKQELFQFDGTVYNSIPVLIEPTDPSNITVGGYWYDTTNKILNRWNVPTPTGFNVIPFIESETDPTAPACGLYWFDNNIAREWNGTTWCEQVTLSSATDPSDCPTVPCGTHWYDENINELLVWNVDDTQWNTTNAIFWPQAPNQLLNGTYWFNDTNSTLSIRNAGVWNDITTTVIFQEIEPTSPTDGLLWFNPVTEELREYSATSPNGFVLLSVLFWPEDPTDITSCELWWDSNADLLYTWDSINLSWTLVSNFIQSLLDPAEPAPIIVNTIWNDTINNILLRWDGGDWVTVTSIFRSTDPTQVALGEAWFMPSTNTWRIWDTPAMGWNIVDPIDSATDPTNIPTGVYWFDTSNNALFVRNGLMWTNMIFSTVPFNPVRGSHWYDTASEVLNTWNGSAWVAAIPCAIAAFNENGGITFSTTGLGSDHAILIPASESAISSTSTCSIGTGFAYAGVNDVAGTQCEFLNNGLVTTYPTRDIPDNSFLWNQLSIIPNILTPIPGNDGKTGIPSYLELGVGTDGTPDERRELADSIRQQLGYPVVEVELTNSQIDIAISRALESFRKRSSASVRRGFYFLNIEPKKQQYLLTNKTMGYNKIVNVMAAFRFNSAFLSSAAGAGVYGQVVLQHLYNMGTYDLTSFFLVSQYIEQLEDLFATRLTFGWHENERILSFYSSFVRPERVLLDCMIERTEQDLLKDRLIKTWLERYALAESMMMLSHIRGKFASLPGAGGGISLNSSELMSLAQSYRDELMQQIDDFVVDTPEDVGQVGTFILG